MFCCGFERILGEGGFVPIYWENVQQVLSCIGCLRAGLDSARIAGDFEFSYLLLFGILPIHVPAVLAFISNYILLNIVHVLMNDKND